MTGTLDWGAPFGLTVQDVYDMGVTTMLIYAFIILAVKLLGVRSISHLNNFDWITIVAIGAITGSAIVSDSVSALEGILAIAALFAAQYAVTFCAARWKGAADILKEDPKILVADGRVNKAMMEHERVSEEEILAEVRGKGLSSFDQVKAVVLESDSTVSVVPKDDAPGHKGSLQDVDD